jgi:hypothetical protein
MRVEVTVPKAVTTVWSFWPGIALGLIFAASASVALADPVESRLREHDLVCRAPDGDPIRVILETAIVSNTPCKRIKLSRVESVTGQTHTIWGCEGKRANGSVKYNFDINDWPAELTVRGPSGVLEKDSQLYVCRDST